MVITEDGPIQWMVRVGTLRTVVTLELSADPACPSREPSTEAAHCTAKRGCPSQFTPVEFAPPSRPKF